MGAAVVTLNNNAKEIQKKKPKLAAKLSDWGTEESSYKSLWEASFTTVYKLLVQPILI